MVERTKEDYLRKGEIHQSLDTLWVNSEKGCEIRINNMRRMNFMTPVKCKISHDVGFIDITLEEQ